MERRLDGWWRLLRDRKGAAAATERRYCSGQHRVLLLRHGRRGPAAREAGLTYARFINGLDRAGIEIDRKVLADIAVHEPATFQSLVEAASAAARA